MTLKAAGQHRAPCDMRGPLEAARRCSISAGVACLMGAATVATVVRCPAHPPHPANQLAFKGALLLVAAYSAVVRDKVAESASRPPVMPALRMPADVSHG